MIGFAIEETVSRLYAFIWQGLRQHTPLRGEDVVLIDDGHTDLPKLGFRHKLDHEPALYWSGQIGQEQGAVTDLAQEGRGEPVETCAAQDLALCAGASQIRIGSHR